jgi:guanylate kinase
MNQPAHKPLLIVISAPSGAGKTTLCERLRGEFPSIAYSVSCTTRPPRVGEINGKNYHFIDEDAFQARLEEGHFLEHAVVHGHRYGTPRDDVLKALDNGHDVIMDIDVQGAAQVRAALAGRDPEDPLRQAYVDIFIAPPSIEDLQLRLFGRGKDDADVISRRIEKAEAEMAHWREYQYLVFNDRIEEAYDTLRSIFLAEHQRVQRMGGET